VPVADALRCEHNDRVGEETIVEKPHLHFWTVKCARCGTITLHRTLGCNCKKKPKEKGATRA
jgi:hypothetical protein